MKLPDDGTGWMNEGRGGARHDASSSSPPLPTTRPAPALRGTALAIGALLALAASCGGPPAVDPAAFQLEQLAPQATAWQRLSSLTAYGEMDLEAEGRRFSGRVRALWVSPGRLRLDAELPGFFGLLGGTGSLWADRQGLRWTTSGDPSLHDSMADPVFGPLLGEAPSSRDLEILLFGLPAWWGTGEGSPETPGPGSNPKREWELHGDPPGGALHLRWPSGRYESGQIGGRPPHLEMLARGDAAGTLVDVQLDAYRTVGGLELPGRLRLRAPRSGGRLEIRWRRHEIDREDAEARLEWPPG